MLRGKRPVNPSILIMLADLWKVSRLELFCQVGWISLSKDEHAVQLFRELLLRNPPLARGLLEVLEASASQEKLEKILSIVATYEEG